MKIEAWQLAQRQSLPLEAKVAMSEARIRAWHSHCHGDTYISFSGGKDSTALLHLVRSLYPKTPAVFLDSGLEYPEVRDFVKTIENVEWIKPKMPFKAVIEKYGYPVVSKEIAMAINRYRVTKDPIQKQLRLHGGINPNSGKRQTKGIISQKWQYLLQAPFKISEKCCDVMKKRPFIQYEKRTGLKPYIGTMAADSRGRAMEYLKGGCNVFNGHQQSRPISFWINENIWAYIKSREIPYAPIYDQGVTNTGCMFCMFGLHFDGHPNRFEMMKKSHPKLYNYCMDVLGLHEVLKWYPANMTEGLHGMIGKGR